MDDARMAVIQQAANAERFRQAVAGLLTEMQAEHLALLKVVAETNEVGDLVKKQYVDYAEHFRVLLDAFTDAAEQCAIAITGQYGSGAGEVEDPLKNAEAAGAELEAFSPLPVKIVSRTLSNLRAKLGYLPQDMDRLVTTFAKAQGYDSDSIEFRLAYAFASHCFKKGIRPDDDKALEGLTGKMAEVASVFHKWYANARAETEA